MRGIIDQKGSVTVIALVVLVAVTALAITLINLSNMEQDMATNEKNQDTDFNESDQCVYATAKYLRLLVDLDAGTDGAIQEGIPVGDPKAPGIVYPSTVDFMELHKRLMRTPGSDPFYEPDPGDGTMKVIFKPAIGFNPNVLPAQGDIRHLEGDITRGTAANQFAAGYSAGVGLGGAGSGSFIKWFIIVCEGRGINQPAAGPAKKVYARYRKASIPGGL